MFIERSKVDIREVIHLSPSDQESNLIVSEILLINSLRKVRIGFLGDTYIPIDDLCIKLFNNSCSNDNEICVDHPIFGKFLFLIHKSEDNIYRKNREINESLLFCYDMLDIIVIYIDISNTDSFDNLKKKWVNEVNKFHNGKLYFIAVIDSEEFGKRNRRIEFNKKTGEPIKVNIEEVEKYARENNIIFFLAIGNKDDKQREFSEIIINNYSF